VNGLNDLKDLVEIVTDILLDMHLCGSYPDDHQLPQSTIDSQS
jgi:hypothetical protein